MFIVLVCPLNDPTDAVAGEVRQRAVCAATINTLFWTDGMDLFIFESHLSAPEVRDALAANADLSRLVRPVTVLQCRAFADVAAWGGIDEHLLRQACDL